MRKPEDNPKILWYKTNPPDFKFYPSNLTDKNFPIWFNNFSAFLYLKQWKRHKINIAAYEDILFFKFINIKFKIYRVTFLNFFTIKNFGMDFRFSPKRIPRAHWDEKQFSCCRCAGLFCVLPGRKPRRQGFLVIFGWLCWGLTSQSTIFQSCRDGAIASWVINQYFRGVKCLAQGHNTAAVGLEPRTSRSGVRHSTTEPPRSPFSWGGPFLKPAVQVYRFLVLSTVYMDNIWPT